MKKIILSLAVLISTIAFSQNVYIDTTKFVYTNNNLYKIKIYKVTRIDTIVMDSLMILNELNTINGQINGKDAMIQLNQSEKQLLNRRKNKLTVEAEKTSWF